MPSANEDFKYESLQDRNSIAKYLDALKDGFSSGKLILGSKEKQIVFEPSGLLKLEVKAKRKGDKVKISLKCGWREMSMTKEQKGESLIIESKKQG